MVAYHGVPRDEVLDSLQRAEAYLRQLDVGNITRMNLDSWLKKDPFTKIAAAQGNAELADLMKHAGFLYDYEQIIRYHALIDGDEDALKLHRDMSKWGAFDGAHPLSYGPEDAETDFYILKKGAAYLAGKKEANRPGKRISLLFHRLAFPLLASRDPDVSASKAIMDFRKGGEDQLKKTFLHAGLQVRHKMVEGVVAMTGLPEKSMEMGKISPFGFYGFVVPVEGSMTFDEIEARSPVKPADLRQVLQPFFATDEVQSVGIGPIVNDMSQWVDAERMGVYFNATRRAAQAVADVFPGEELIDGNGNAVLPSNAVSRQRAPRKPGNTP